MKHLLQSLSRTFRDDCVVEEKQLQVLSENRIRGKNQYQSTRIVLVVMYWRSGSTTVMPARL
jgi:hypothetical protein